MRRASSLLANLGFFGSLMIAGETALHAELPLPSIARSFAEALDEGDLRSARAMLGPSVEVIQNDSFDPSSIEKLIKYVRGCRHTALATERVLEDPSLTSVRTTWRCPDRDVEHVSFQMRGGQFKRVSFGPPIRILASNVAIVAYDFVGRLVADRNVASAEAMLAPAAVILNNIDHAETDLAEILSQVANCRMGGIAESGNIATVPWNCPDGRQLFLALHTAGMMLSRIELEVRPTTPEGDGQDG